MSLLSNPNKSMLVVAPHADDEVLSAGGLILRATAAGWAVRVLFMTISGFVSSATGKNASHAVREKEVERAAAAMALSSFTALYRGEEHHLRLDMVAQADLIAFVEEGIARSSPSVCVVPGLGHYHQDHRATAAACLAAMRPAPAGGRGFVSTILAYGHSAGGYGGQPYAFLPNTFVDISDVIENKLAALACYESQLCAPPHPRSLEGVRHSCAAWGAYSGTQYAEPFECIRHVI